MTHPVAVFVSGTGRHMENFIELSRNGQLAIDVRLVISSSAQAPALAKAAALSVPALHVPSKGTTPESYSKALFAAATRSGAQTILLAGFLKRMVIAPAWEGRVLNIHPSLLPAFGGAGYYGHHVHAAALARGVQISGCTVHLVDNQFDNGPILLQRSCPVLPEDGPDTLAARVFELERETYPDAVRLFLNSTAQRELERP